MDSKKIRVLFVCLGNICRSPTAQGVFEKLVSDANLTDSFEIDSAGCGGYHVGEQPDPRSMAAARKRGIDLSTQRARQITKDDFRNFDYILAMDRSNLRHLEGMMPSDSKAIVKLFLEYATDPKFKEVPDPYNQGPQGFELVLDLIETASTGLLKEIQNSSL